MVWDNTQVSCFEERFQTALNKVKVCGYSHIDILVNNAGVLGAPMPNAREEEFDRVIDTNLKGVLFLSQLFGKYLEENKNAFLVVTVAGVFAWWIHLPVVHALGRFVTLVVLTLVFASLTVYVLGMTQGKRKFLLDTLKRRLHL